jgi:two-component system response regulator DesR
VGSPVPALNWTGGADADGGSAGGERPRLRPVDGDGAEPADGRAPVRVLIADDHDGIRFLLATVLSLEDDFEVVAQAATGTAAVAAAEAEDVDLIVLDLSMPELDGLEVLERVAAAGRDIRVVVYTGLTHERVVERARALGARDVLTKGMPLPVVVDRLREATRS